MGTSPTAIGFIIKMVIVSFLGFVIPVQASSLFAIGEYLLAPETLILLGLWCIRGWIR